MRLLLSTSMYISRIIEIKKANDMKRFVHGIILTELRSKRGQEKFPLSYSPVHVFLVFTVALHLTNCSSFQIEWSRHYHECPCLRNVDMARKTFDAKTLDNCFIGCMATDGCHAFSYCVSQLRIHNGNESNIP